MTPRRLKNYNENFFTCVIICVIHGWSYYLSVTKLIYIFPNHCTCEGGFEEGEGVVGDKSFFGVSVRFRLTGYNKTRSSPAAMIDQGLLQYISSGPRERELHSRCGGSFQQLIWLGYVGFGLLSWRNLLCSNKLTLQALKPF